MEDIGCMEQCPRCLCGSLHEIVVVGVDTGYHVTPGIRQDALYGRPFATPYHLLPCALLGREHYLEIAC